MMLLIALSADSLSVTLMLPPVSRTISSENGQKERRKWNGEGPLSGVEGQRGVGRRGRDRRDRGGPSDEIPRGA
jgi:hypothetical protein